MSQQNLIRQYNSARTQLDLSVSLLERALDLRELLARAKSDFFFCQMLDVRALQAELDSLNRELEQRHRRKAA
jgi:hypothetical protein